MYTLVEHDTGVELRITCTEGADASLINLTGSTVLLRWRGIEEPVERTMTILDAPNGLVSYIFVGEEVVAPDMEFEVQITTSAGTVRTCLQRFRERVRERLT